MVAEPEMNTQWPEAASGEGEQGLGVRVAPGPGHVVVAVTGDLDMTTELAFREALLAEAARPARRVVADLTGVGFMALAGLHVLLAANQRVKAAGGSLILAGAPPVVARVLSLSGTDEVIPMAADVKEALG